MPTMSMTRDVVPLLQDSKLVIFQRISHWNIRDIGEFCLEVLTERGRQALYAPVPVYHHGDGNFLLAPSTGEDEG